MSAAHTPGPWMVDDEQEAKHHLYVRHVDSGRICQCFANCLVTTDAAVLANARLIAAAPEMLEACREQHAAIDFLMARLIALDPEFRPTKGPHWRAVVNGNAAIAKATGSK